MLIYSDDLHRLQVIDLAFRKNDGYSLEALLSVLVFMAGKEYLCRHRKQSQDAFVLQQKL